VPVIRANSASRATSALERASRVISIPKIASTSPEQTRVTSVAALPARAYWLLVDSVCSRTWAIEDWRRYISTAR
jgi:hypothetical protein